MVKKRNCPRHSPSLLCIDLAGGVGAGPGGDMQHAVVVSYFQECGTCVNLIFCDPPDILGVLGKFGAQSLLCGVSADLLLVSCSSS